MAEFKFSFNVEKNHECKDTLVDTKKKTNPSEWFEASEIVPSDNIIENLDDIFPKAKMYLCGDTEIGHVYPEDGVKYLMDFEDTLKVENNVISAECNHSDLVTGQYEGGMKIWECTMDLAEYLTKENVHFKDKNVMDLGCGAGILGIIALINGSTVHFQDYNKEVVHSVTIPNCLLNIKENERNSIRNKCKFFCGDWESLSNLMSDDEIYKYDYILSSETIYNVECYEKLYNFIEKHLKNDGVAYIAAKTYYFGVGGGVRQFVDFIEKIDRMKSEVIWKSSGGVFREILKITFK